MRRAHVAVLCFGLITLGLGAGVPTAGAADPLTGRLVDSTGSHPAVAGATVRLRTVTPDGVGPVVDSDTTNGDGEFALDAGAAPEDEYFVQVLPGRYQGGYVGGAPGETNYVQPTAGYATTYGPHAHIGKILANPAFIRGFVVSSNTKNPLEGVKVTARSANTIGQVEGSDITGARGGFVIKGLECEDDCYLKVNGASKGYEVGFRDCNGTVVADWGDACASPIGRIGKVFLDKS
jgi:hypothetical protein